MEEAFALAALVTPSINQRLGHWPVPFTSAMAEAKVSGTLSVAARGASLTEVVLNDGIIAGWIGSNGPPGRASFGYWLSDVHQKQGPLRIRLGVDGTPERPPSTPHSLGHKPSPQTREVATS